MSKREIARGDRVSQLIAQRIRELGDWRGEMLAKLVVDNLHLKM
jgi:hypothetical protein